MRKKNINFFIFLKKLEAGLANAEIDMQQHMINTGSTYNKDEDEQYSMYFDVNNLYGWAMIQPLP